MKSINEKKEKFFLSYELTTRAEKLGIEWKGASEPHMTLMMDLENTLSLADMERLKEFDDGNFAHDIIGIQNNFNRETKEMDNFFMPRCHRAN